MEYKNPAANTVPDVKLLNISSPKVKDKANMFILTTSIQHCGGVHSSCHKIRKTNKIHKCQKNNDSVHKSPLELTKKKSYTLLEYLARPQDTRKTYWQ